MFGEVLFFTRLAVDNGDQGFEFTEVALICSFSPPDNEFLRTSCMTVSLCRTIDAILVVPVQHILSIVAMVLDGDSFFVVEQPGLSDHTGQDGAQVDDDDDDSLVP